MLIARTDLIPSEGRTRGLTGGRGTIGWLKVGFRVCMGLQVVGVCVRVALSDLWGGTTDAMVAYSGWIVAKEQTAGVLLGLYAFPCLLTSFAYFALGTSSYLLKYNRKIAMLSLATSGVDFASAVFALALARRYAQVEHFLSNPFIVQDNKAAFADEPRTLDDRSVLDLTDEV